MLASLIFYSCTPELPEKYTKEEVISTKTNILLITIDTLRADRVGVYGDTKAQTNTIDSLAQEGVLFREAHSLSPLTLPSHSSILTGLYPNEHGVRDNAGFVLSEKIDTIAEALKTEGYNTSAFVSAFVLEHSWGLAQGFDRYHDPFHPKDLSKVAALGEAQIPSADTINAAQAWWKNTKGPKFSWVHLYDPHTPWDTKTGDPYRGDIAQADQNLARLIAQTDPSDLIIVTSDHGESLWEHGEREHGVLLHRSVTRVPLIIRPPGGIQGVTEPPSRESTLVVERPEGVDSRLILDPVQDAPKAGYVVNDVVRLIDIAPTIADYAEVSFSSSGLSLRPFVEGKPQPSRIAYAETLFPYYHLGWSSMTMVQDGQRRVEKGLDARASLWQSAQKTLPTSALLDEMSTRFGGEIPTPGAVTSSQQEALQALGYMSGPEAAKQEIDPRDHIHVLSALFQAQELPHEQAIPALHDLIKTYPNMIHAYTALTLQYVQAGKIEDAFIQTEKALRLFPSETQNLNNAAMLARQLGRLDEALAFVEAMRVASPTDVRSYRIETAIYVDQDNPKAVIKTAKAGLELASEDPNLHYLISLAYIFEEKPQKALEHLTLAQKHHSMAKDLSLWKGIAYEKMGDVQRAVESYDQATQDLPKDLRAWARGGVLLAEHNQCKEARRFLSNAVLRGAPPDSRMKEALQKCPPADTP